MELKRVVVTGLGALTPVGNTVNEYWNGLINGVSGAAPIKQFKKFRTFALAICKNKRYMKQPIISKTLKHNFCI